MNYTHVSGYNRVYPNLCYFLFSSQESQRYYTVFYYLLTTMISMTLTKFEKARIIGARSLQISMGAPVIIDVPKEIIDPVDIAIMEYENNVIPITIRL